MPSSSRRVVSLRAPFVLMVVLAGVSCFPGAKAPNVAPSRTLSLEEELASKSSGKAFGVVFAGPKGPTEDPSEVTVVFNRPMRALELAGAESPSPVTITAKDAPPPEGEWRWMGTSGLVFAPKTALPRATEFTVKVPAGTKSLAGEQLKDGYVFSFTTPPPRVVRLEPGEGASRLVPSQKFELRFNQPVDPREVERTAKLFVGEDKKSKSVPFKASWPKPDTKMLVQIVPAAPLPLDTRVAIELGASLRGLEGPLPTGTAKTVEMRTYGPLRAGKLDCFKDTPHGKCAARDSVRVELTNRVKYKEWKTHVRLDPPLKIDWGTASDDENLSDNQGVWARLRAARGYKLIVLAGMKDEFGQVLAKDAVLPFETDDEWPEVEVGLSGSIFEALRPKPKEIPIGSVNQASFEVLTAALDEVETTKILTRKSNGGRGRDEMAELKKLAHTTDETVRPSAPANVQAIKKVSLDAILASKKGRGAALLAIRAPERHGESRDETHVLSVTDLAVTAKMSRFGSLVWVSRLSDGKPAAGAIVTVRGPTGSEIFATKTDAGGVATIPVERYSPVRPDGQPDDEAVITARVGDDWAFRQVSEMLSPWRFQPSSDPAGRLTPFGMLITDRGIYKAGETVRVKGLFRKPLARGTETPKGREVHFEAYDPGGEKFFEKSLALGAFGDFALDVPIAAAAKLGSIELRAELPEPKPAPGAPALSGDESVHLGSASTNVQVAAYRPAEFKVAVEPDKPAYIRGDKASYVVRGDYLFGAPMSDGKVRTTVTRGPGSFTPPGVDRDALVLDDDAFFSDIYDGNERAAEIDAKSGALAAKGEWAGQVLLALPHQRGTEVVTIEGEVEDVSRQVIAGRSSAIVHPGEFYLATKRPKELFVPKGTLSVETAAIEPTGKRRGAVPIKVELVRRTWHTVVETSGESGLHYDSKPKDTVVTSCTASSSAAATLASCSLPLVEPGYYLVHATAKDPRGNDVASSFPLYVLGEGEQIGWSMTDAAKLDLVLDKKSYEVGETATLLVKSPFKEAEAWITVERAGVYRQERRLVSGPMPIVKIPITEDLRPNAFVSVHLVRGRTQEPAPKGADGKSLKAKAGGDVGAPAFRLGYAEVIVNPEARRLTVAVVPSKRELRPGEDLDVDVAVTDRAGKPVRSNVTFYAVDEGVLMLTAYKTPDPIPVFTAPRPLSVFSLESREDLAKILLTSLGNSGADKGGEGGGGGDVRHDFRATAYFEPSLVAVEGKAHVKFKLPDSLTTYRLMAVVAAEDDRFGFGESQITASRKLMARPALPRFMRAGDSIDAGIVVSSKGMPATQVEVTAQVTGATLGGEAKKMVALPANGSVEVRWPIATPKSGQAKLAFRVKAGGESDAVEVTREVMVPLSMEAVALYGETTEASAEKLGDLRAMRDDVGGLDVRLASTALVGLDEGVEHLLQYPYGCTEQLVSRLVPLVALRDLATDYGVKLPKNLGPVIDEAIGKVVKNQLPDGSFGYWSDSPRGNAWVTTYALWGLHQAKLHGHSVPEGVIDHAKESTRRYLHTDLGLLLNLPVRAFVLDVLAQMGDPDPGAMTQLYEQRAKLPLFGRALLAHAMTISKMGAKEVPELLRDVDNHLRVTPTGATVTDNTGDAYAVFLDSEARTTALVLRALVAHDKKSPLASRIAKGLLGMRHGGTWRTTQETAWSLIALDDYRRAQEVKAPDFDAKVFFGESEVFSGSFHERTVKAEGASFAAQKLFSAGAGGQTLAFQVQGQGKLFYEARLRYSKKELPKEGLDRGFFVRKVLRRLAPEDLRASLGSVPAKSADAVAGGDLVLVDLFVVTPDPRENVVIDDPLPAGLEAVQAGLATTARSLDVTDAGGEGDEDDERASGDDERAAGRATTFAWYHREMKDDRVLTFVEHMPAGLYHYRYLARATTFGRFVVPPTRAECMYEPETFGRTGATTFAVERQAGGAR